MVAISQSDAVLLQIAIAIEKVLVVASYSYPSHNGLHTTLKNTSRELQINAAAC